MAQNRQDMREFLLRACHDLRAHLRAVRTNSELLLGSAEIREGTDTAKMLEFLVHGAAGANSIVDAISNYALALDIRPSPAPVSTGLLLRGAIAKLSNEIAGTGAHVEYGELPAVPGDPDRLMQLFENLLRNAIENRGDAPPRIDIGARREADQWVFAVRDNGPGIDPEDLERVFRPFERRDRAKAGLGLAICREIINGHGGRIWAESAPGAGTTILFTLSA